MTFPRDPANQPTAGGTQAARDVTAAAGAALTLAGGATLQLTDSFANNGTATLPETEASYVIGWVALTCPLMPGIAEAFNGLGLTPAIGSTAPGNTVLICTIGTPLTGAGTSQSVLCAFDIQPATNTGLSVTMAFAYFDHELNGIPVANLVLFKSVATPAGPWVPQRPGTLGPNMVTKTDIAAFSLWTLGNSTNPLPVELWAFTATAPIRRALGLGHGFGKEQRRFRRGAQPRRLRLRALGHGDRHRQQQHSADLWLRRCQITRRGPALLPPQAGGRGRDVCLLARPHGGAAGEGGSPGLVS